MKLLIISDSHQHIANLKTIGEISRKSKIDAIIHCGDWDNIESVKTILDFGIPLFTVMGNADVEEDLEEYIKFNAKKFDPSFLKLNIDGRKIGITHQVRKNDVRQEGLDVVFSGHYHSKDETMINFTKFIRPGALINGINFAVYETTNNSVKFIQEN